MNLVGQSINSSSCVLEDLSCNDIFIKGKIRQPTYELNNRLNTIEKHLDEIDLATSTDTWVLDPYKTEGDFLFSTYTDRAGNVYQFETDFNHLFSSKVTVNMYTDARIYFPVSIYCPLTLNSQIYKRCHITETNINIFASNIKVYLNLINCTEKITIHNWRPTNITLLEFNYPDYLDELTLDNVKIKGANFTGINKLTLKNVISEAEVYIHDTRLSLNGGSYTIIEIIGCEILQYIAPTISYLILSRIPTNSLLLVNKLKGVKLLHLDCLYNSRNACLDLFNNNTVDTTEMNGGHPRIFLTWMELLTQGDSSSAGEYITAYAAIRHYLPDSSGPGEPSEVHSLQFGILGASVPGKIN